MKRVRWAYLKEFWNVLDLVVIVVSICCICFNIYRTIHVNEILNELLLHPEQYADFDNLSYWQEVFNSAVAFMVFCAWIKVGLDKYCRTFAGSVADGKR